MEEFLIGAGIGQIRCLDTIEFEISFNAELNKLLSKEYQRGALPYGDKSFRLYNQHSDLQLDIIKQHEMRLS